MACFFKVPETPAKKEAATPPPPTVPPKEEAPKKKPVAAKGTWSSVGCQSSHAAHTKA